MTTICRTRVVHSSSNFYVTGMPTATSLLSKCVCYMVGRIETRQLISSDDLFCRRHRSRGDGIVDPGCAKIEIARAEKRC